MKNPKTQKEQVLWYLLNFKSFSLKDVINDSMFYKFQSRLSDLEAEHGKLAHRIKNKFVNRFGNYGYNYIYSAIDRNKIQKLYENRTN